MAEYLGTVAKAQRKRKSSENDASSVTKPRLNSNNNAYSNKEDLENKQGRKRNSYNRGAKKKVLEEANNSKLRHVQVRVEDCLQNGQRSGTLSAICRRQSHESTSEPSPAADEDHEQPSPASGTAAVVVSVVEETSSSTATTLPLHDETSNSSSVELVQLDEEEDDDEEEVIVDVRQSLGSAGVTNTTTSAITTIHNDKGERVRTPASVLSTPGAAVPLVEVEAVSEEDDCVIVAEELHRPPPPTVQTVQKAVPSRTVVDDSVIVTSSGGAPASTTQTAGSVVSGIVVVERGANVLLRECDDDGPLSSSSPFSRMELSDGSGTTLLRFPDDRSDSGVSSLRSGSCASGDERSGSRSSALSSSDEPQQLHNGIQSTSSSSSSSTSSSSLLSATITSNTGSGNSSSGHHISNSRSSLFVPTTSSSSAAAAAAAEAVRVWRDPSLLLESEPHVRHIHSVQHQSLLMSHPAVPASSAPSPSSAAVVATSTPPAPAAVAVHYPGVVPPPPPLLSPHPMHHHPHAVPPHHLAPPPGLYSQMPEILWKQRYPPLPVGAAHLLGPQPAHPAAEELIERERVYVQDRDRLIRERREQEVREMEKQQHKEREKERERMERERERQEREKMEREREREKQVERERQDRIEREQERERQEKQRAEQAVHKHFEESLRLAHQKFVDSLQRERSNMATWNLISLPPPQRGSAAEEERKRAEQEHQQREQQHRQMASERFRQEQRDRAAYYAMNSQRSPNIPAKAEYPPPAHSRVSTNIKSNDKMNVGHTSLPKAEPNFSLFGYPAYQPSGFVTHESKVKVEHHKQPSQGSGLIVNKSSSAMQSDRDRDLVLSNPPPLISEMKSGGSSVIVKHEVKSPHHLEPKVNVAHSPSPKLRGSDMMSHYIPTTAASQQHKAAGLYEYRSPTQSPHHLQHPHTPSPHHHMEPQNLGKSHPPSSHHRSNSGSSGGGGQLPSPHAMHQRQSPHMHSQSSPHPSSAEARYRSAAAAADAQMYAAAGGGGMSSKAAMSAAYSYLPQTTMGTTVPSHYALAVSSASTGSSSKPKVSSPAPPHIYGKPNAGIVTGIPVCRIQEVTPPSNPIPLTSKPPLPSSVSPSPYQQVSQYHPPHMHQSTMAATCPPPAHHSSRTTNMDPRAIYERNMYTSGTVPGGMSAKPLMQHHGTSPPTATAAPSPMSRSPHLTHTMSQMPMSMHQSQISAPAVQTQPLDLGVSSDRNSNRDELSSSPKRKGTPLSHPIGGPLSLDVKKRRMESSGQPSHIAVSAHTLSSLHGGNPAGQPQLARVSEPSPLIASAATTITTVVNTAAYRTPANTIIISQSHPTINEHGHIPSTQQPVPTDMSHTSSAPTISNVYTDSTNKMVVSTPPSTASNSTPTVSVSPVSVSVANSSSPVLSATSVVSSASSGTSTADQQPPSTPVKVTLTPSVVDSEKSNSPGPIKTSTTTTSSTNYPVRHLKKAWLQRHTGEDVEDTTGVKGSGTCVTLPIPNVNNPANNTQAKETSVPVTSLHSIGSMAVNSINKTKTLSNKGNGRKGNSSKDTGSLNGHGTDPSKGDDSSSSDQERGRKSPPKRKPPKVKRKKGGGGVKKTSTDDSKKRKGGSVVPSSVASESGSESDKESGSEKDSDSGASTNQASGAGPGGGGGSAGAGVGGKKTTNGGSTNTSGASKDKEPRKRGRRPKSSKNDKGEEPRNKKSRDEPSLPQRDPFRKPPVGQLKKTGESFLQDGPCFEVAPKLAKCRECRWTPNQRSKNMPNIFCRFYAFRRLRYTKNGQLAIAGFSDPHKDASEEDLKLWLPLSDNPPPDLDLEMSRLLLLQVGDHFCDLLVQERDALAEHMSEDKTIAWKRVVQGVREMCDVCETTLFNFHWACGKCGFVVCLDCYKGRKNGTVKIWGEPGKDRDEFSWLQCTNRQPHEQEKLMLTQIIAGDSLQKLGRRTHEFRELWGIPQYCACPMSKDSKSINGAAYKDIIKSLIKGELNGIKMEKKEDGDSEKSVNGIAVKDEKKSPLSWLADVALSNEDKKEECSSDSDGDKEGNFSTLRELLIRPSHKSNGSRAASPANTVANPNNNGLPKNSKKSRMETLDEVISSVIEDTVHKNDELMHDVKQMELKHFVRRYNWQTKGREPLPIRIMTLTESKILYPNTPHSWLCDGKLLRLTDPNNTGNYRIFQDQWKRGQPVIVSDISRNLDMDLWHPDSFIRDFGDEKNDLINCMTGKLVPNQAMSKFWEGFEHFSKRLKDERGNPMLLKLKDWPPGEDFAELMPSRFNDLMQVLPLSEYTHRSGRLNLASRLPECFVRPDLGPKMYNAYGSALHPTKGTTNLHLDISDAVNVMVYVGIPKDGDNDEHIKEAFRAIDEAGCDILTRRRVRDKGELPGALWHIYNARDADKIRDLLNKVALEKGERLEPHHDPIHDQSGYLDGPLRERLYKEYGVEGYAIVQCLGDAVFIPAGAPHQVRNLHNCIKVAEDFVSPENVSHCFHLTQEFRELSDTHTNHEDKLQIKNIIYHTVKDSLSVLSSLLKNHTVKSEMEDGLLDGCGGQNSVASGQTHHSGASSSDSNSPSGSPASHDTDSKEPA